MGLDEKEFGTPDTKERLGIAWRIGPTAEAWGILNEEVRRWCVGWIIGNFGHQGISEEDAEDCFSEAMEGLLKRAPIQVTDPYNYVFASAKNAALDILRERKPLIRRDPEWDGQEDELDEHAGETGVSKPTAWLADGLLVITEATLDIEVTARTEQLRAVYRLALPKLAPNRRRLVEVLLDRGTDMSIAALADIMGCSESALKSLKSRAIADLRELLPLAAQQLGINLDSLLSPVPEALIRLPVLPTTEEDIEPIL